MDYHSRQDSQQNFIPCPICSDGKLYKGTRGLSIHTSRRHPIQLSDQHTSNLSQNLPSHSSNIQLGQQDTTATEPPIWEYLSNLKCNNKILKRIPRGARISVAQSLGECILQVVTHNTISSWHNLFTFAYSVLHIKNTNNNLSLTNKIKINTTQMTFPDINLNHRKHISGSKENIVESKISEGNVRGAAMLLFSEDAIASNSHDTLKSLQDKHPLPLPSTYLPSPPSSDQPSFIQICENDVLHILSTFPNGSSGGLDSITPQHLKDLISPQTVDAGNYLLTQLTSLINFMLAGQVNPDIIPILYGANLVALHKKDGGIRPIAVGNIFRRIASKLCCRHYKERFVNKFQPLQFGFGIRGGSEAAVHAARTYLNSKNYEVFLKIDLKNAFNSLDRGVFLSEAKNFVPEIYHYLWQSYSIPTKLMFQGSSLNSSVGCQQGDPLGPAIFSLAIHSIISSFKSKFNLWYLDDGTLGGKSEVVLEDLQELITKFSSLGLSLNYNKCEIYIAEHIEYNLRQDIINKFNFLTPNITILNKSTLSLLGAPIFNEAIPNFLSGKLDLFNKMSVHLLKINPHIAIYILRLCLFTPKLTYFLRCCPLWKFPNIIKHFDCSLKDLLSKILNVKFEDRTFCQATLPIKFGGLGIRLPSNIALPAFLSSVHSLHSQIGKILNLPLNDLEVCSMDEARRVWSDTFPSTDIPLEAGVQRLWDLPGVEQLYNKLLEESTSDSDRARLLAVKEPESGFWLHALPSKHLGNLLDQNTLRVSVCLRLGARICEPHQCSCGRDVDRSGHHGLSCIKSAGRIYRHCGLNELIRRALTTVSVPSILEPPGICRDDGKRPDGATVVPWSHGRSLVWDATCVDTLAPSHIRYTSKKAGAASEQAQILKRRKYSSLMEDYIFAAFAVETLGPWSSDTKKLIKNIGSKLVHVSSDPRAVAFYSQKVSLTIQRGNAASVLGTMPHGTNLDSIFIL